MRGREMGGRESNLFIYLHISVVVQITTFAWPQVNQIISTKG